MIEQMWQNVECDIEKYTSPSVLLSAGHFIVL